MTGLGAFILTLLLVLIFFAMPFVYWMLTWDRVWPAPMPNHQNPKPKKKAPKIALWWFRAMFAASLVGACYFFWLGYGHNTQGSICATHVELPPDWVYDELPCRLTNEFYVLAIISFPYVFNILQFPLLIGWMLAHVAHREPATN